MPKPLLIVSFWTEGTGYQAEVPDFVRACDDVGLAHHVECVPNRGSWFANAAYRAVWLEQQLWRCGDRHRLVWLDIDARARRYPDALEGLDCDFAAAWVDGGVCGGTLYLEHTPGAQTLLRTWAALNDHGPAVEKSDQNLRTALAVVEAAGYVHVRTERLPPEYAHIPGVHPRLDRPVVFEHDMAGFRYWPDRHARKARFR